MTETTEAQQIRELEVHHATFRLRNSLAKLGTDVKGVRRLNIIVAAQSMAASAYAKGERFHAGNRTTYPKKRYGKLERMFGVMNAKELVLFDDAYDAYMAWHGEVDR